MDMSIPSLSANKWHPETRKPLYPSPQSILRRAVGEEAYKFISEMPNTEGIRAAVIMPRNIPFKHLLNEPWNLVYYNDDWVMILTSTLDPYRWIELARATGAIAWQRGHAKTVTYQWAPPELDAQGHKIRPPNALGMTGKPGQRSDAGVPKKFDCQAMLDDLKAGSMTHSEIADKHGVSRYTVIKFSQRNGLSKRTINV